ncbi:MAG TPA: hypothetical protein PK389_04195 [Gammaproteobacteria bacterium]|nr:hypothetical protein [Gammaproteobacteria bacterium]
MESHYDVPDDIDIESECVFCLSEYLNEEYDFLECDYNLAKHNKEPDDIIATAFEKLNQFKKLISKAKEYANYFDDEIAKGESSKIRIHKPDSSFTPHYTVVSIHEWAKETLKFPNCSLDSFLKNNTDLSEAPENDDQSNQEEWKSPTSAETFHTTFAFLVESFALTSAAYNIDGKLNVDAIAKHLQECAEKANQGHSLTGQSSNNIRKMIPNSLKIKKKVLHKRGDRK